MSYKISIVIPVYKVEKYLKNCVDSVINQTYKNIEVILVDDGSPDDCPLICDEYVKNDSRIKVVHKTNGGLSSARNAGMKIATGDYIMFLDSDDFWDDDLFLYKLSRKMKNDADVIVIGYKKYYKKDNQFINGYSTNFKINSTDKEIALCKIFENSAYESNAWTKVVSRRLLSEKLCFIENILSEDIDWSARLLINAKSFDVYEDNVYVYRMNEESISHNLSEKNIVDLRDQIIRIVNMSKQIEKETYYKWYMNYCAYQYITFLNCIVCIDQFNHTKKYMDEMKSYRYLLKYHQNKKVKKIFCFDKIFGYRGMLKILKIFLKMRG